tara:strand:+ start:751 stop:990 length:240 start_codon:yes stop_codon:yes gene_type:complete
MNNLDFEKFILKEINSICKEESLNLQLNLSNDNSLNLKEECENVSKEIFEEDTKELKVLTEEICRMKELLNFKSPLLER